MDGHGGAAGLEVGDDLLEAVGRGRRRDDLVLRAEADIEAVGLERGLRNHATLGEIGAAAEHERPPVVVAAGTTAHAEAEDAALGQGPGGCQELVEGRRRLETGSLEQVDAVVEVDHHILQRQIVLMAVAGLVDRPDAVGNVGASGPGRNHLLDRRQRLHLDQARLIVELDHGAVGRVAGNDAGEQACVVVVAAAPRNTLGGDLDARILGFELGDEIGGRGFGVVKMVPPANGGGCSQRWPGQHAGDGSGSRQLEKCSAFHLVFLPSSLIASTRPRKAPADARARCAAGSFGARPRKPWMTPGTLRSS